MSIFGGQEMEERKREEIQPAKDHVEAKDCLKNSLCGVENLRMVKLAVNIEVQGGEGTWSPL